MPFPEVRTLSLTFRASRAVELPCLPTVAFHSVFGAALHALVCDMPEQTPCAGCSHAGHCSYPLLMEPEGSPGMGLGVTNRAPPPVVIAPEEPVLSSSPVLLAAAARIRIRMTFIGPAAIANEPTAIRAMALGCEGGLGRAFAQRKEYVPLELEDVSPVGHPKLAPPTSCLLELVSPLRLKSEGKIRTELTVPALLGGIVRRVDTLARSHGGGQAPPAPEHDGVRITSQSLRVIEVRRYSARQDRAMQLPGVAGRLELQGDLTSVWDWLVAGEQLQIGKGTSLGFGRYRLMPLACSS